MAANSSGRLVKFHRWIGLALALPLLIIAGSGIVLGFYDELRHGEAPYRMGSPVEDALSPDRLAQAVRRAFPGFRLQRLYLPTAPERTARAQLEGDRAVTVFLHPGTGAILAVQKTARQDWLNVLYDLHHGKLFHLPGQIVASLSGLGITVLWLMGLLLWRRRPARGYPWRGKKMRVKLSSLHRWLGLYLAAPVAVLALAGALLNFAAPLKQWLDPSPKIEVGKTCTGPLPLAQTVASAHQAYSEVSLERIYFPADQNCLFRMRFQDGGWVYIDACKGKVIKVSTPFSHWTNLLYPLHSGRLFGPRGPWLIAVGGVVLLILLVTGLALVLRHHRGPSPDGRRSLYYKLPSAGPLHRSRLK